MTLPEPSNHQPLEELLEICDEVIAHSSDEDLGSVVERCYSRISSTSQLTDERLEELLECLELLELDRRTQRLEDDTESTGALRGVCSSHRQIGRFQIQHMLGRGGFGVVYLAEDPVLCRKVAIKIPRPEIMASESLRARFVRESQVVAKLSHPCIVQIHEAGQSGLVSFQVMEYCSGGSLASFLSQMMTSEDHPKALPPLMAVELILAVAEGVEHAHRHGILHRDLKPANILLQTIGSEVPSVVMANETDVRTSPEILKRYRPVVTDFGLAKLLADASDSLPHQGKETENRHQTSMAGTPNYMAPEQFEAHTQPVSAATDVFGLGVILFELLAGRPMFVRNEINATQSICSDKDPHQITHRRTERALCEDMPALPGDLVAICQKATASASADRYQTVEQMSDDLRAFLRGEPIRARQWSTLEGVVRWTIRRPTIASLIGLVCVLTVGFVTFGIWHLARLTELNQELTKTAAERERQSEAAMEASRRADQQARVAEKLQRLAEKQTWIAHEREYATEMIQASQAWKAQDVPMMNEHLQRIRTIPGRYSDAFELQYLSAQTGAVKSFLGHKDTIIATRWDFKNRRLYSISRDSTIRCWNVDTQELISTFDFGEESTRKDACFNPSGTVAIISQTLEQSNQDEVLIVDLRTNQVVMRRFYGMHDVCSISISADGQWVAVAGRTQPSEGEFIPFLEIWSSDSEDGKEKAFTKAPITIDLPPCHAVYACRFVGQSHDLVTATVNLSADGWEYELGFIGLQTAISAPTGEKGQSQVKLVSSGKIKKGRPVNLQSSDDGSCVAVMTDQAANRIDVWSLLSGIQKLERQFGTVIPVSMQLASDGESLALSLRTLKESDWDSIAVLPRHSSKGATEAFFSWDLTTDLLSLTPYQPTGAISSIEPLMADGAESWVLGEQGGSLNVWSPGGKNGDQILQGHQPLETWAVAYSPNGKSLYTAGDDHMIRCWSMDSESQVCQSEIRNELVSCLAISPDGKYVAAGGYDDLVTVHDATSLNTVATLTGHTHDVRAIAFSTDGQKLATGGRDRCVRVWSMSDFQCLQELTSHTDTIRAVAWMNDGGLLSSDSEGVVNVWNADGSLRAAHLEHEGVLSIAIAPAGVQLPLAANRSVAMQGKSQSFGNTTLGQSNSSLMAVDGTQEDGKERFLNDGIRSTHVVQVGVDELIAFGMARGSVRMFHRATGQTWSLQRQSNVEVRSLTFSRDGTSVVGGCGDGSIRFWQTSTQREILRLENPSAVHQVAFSPDGTALAAALHDGSVKLFEANSSNTKGIRPPY